MNSFVFGKKVFLFLILLSMIACSSQTINRDGDYQNSVNKMRVGNADGALADFPTREQNGFVTTAEKSWIGFWNGADDQSQLRLQLKTVDDRKVISLSREAQYFFMSETEEGYVPGEHEVIALHLLSAMYFMKSHHWDEARVEARLAGYYLQTMFNPQQVHFDDPALRVWLAGVWAALGEWPEAQVDLRKAYELSGDANLLRVSEMGKAPSSLTVKFYGISPDLDWIDGELVPQFSNYLKKPKEVSVFSTLPWYQRHAFRNSQIRDVALKSNYMAQYYEVKTTKAYNYSKETLIAAGGATVGVAAITAGAALPALFVVGWGTGMVFNNRNHPVSSAAADKTQEREAIRDLHTYRFIRYLPNWISFSDKKTQFVSSGASVKLNMPTAKTDVYFVQIY